MADVLVVKGGVKDYSSAKRYGALREVVFTSRDMRNISRHLSDSIDLMKGYKDKGTPYILLSGNLSLVIPLVLASYEVFGTVKMLIYNIKNNYYSEREVTKAGVWDYLSIQNCDGAKDFVLRKYCVSCSHYGFVFCPQCGKEFIEETSRVVGGKFLACSYCKTVFDETGNIEEGNYWKEKQNREWV